MNLYFKFQHWLVFLSSEKKIASSKLQGLCSFAVAHPSAIGNWGRYKKCYETLYGVHAEGKVITL
jgi:hypothetical protein